MPAARLRSQLERCTTVLRRKLKTYRRCSTLSQFVARSQPARHGSRVARSRVAPPPERQTAQWRVRVRHTNAGYALEVTARGSHHGLVFKERGFPLVQCLFIVRKPISTSASRHARAMVAYFANSCERQPPQWRLRACHANAGYALEVTARTSRHGLAPKETGLSPVQYPRIFRRLITATAALRACGKVACVATSRETASAVARACVPRECRVRVGGHSSHVAPRPCAKRERSPAGAVPSNST